MAKLSRQHSQLLNMFIGENNEVWDFNMKNKEGISCYWCAFSTKGNRHVTNVSCGVCAWKSSNVQGKRWAGAGHGMELSEPEKRVEKSHRNAKIPQEKPMHARTPASLVLYHSVTETVSRPRIGKLLLRSPLMRRRCSPPAVSSAIYHIHPLRHGPAIDL